MIQIKEHTPQNSINTKKILWNGIRGLCPNCGKGKLFKSYLKQAEACLHCHEKFSHLKADDGPAWLTIMIVGHLAAPFMIFFALNETLPLWVATLIILSCATILALLLLSRSKGLFIAILWLLQQKKTPPLD